MAAEKYFPFRSVSGDRKYSAEDWAAYFALFIGNGIFYSSADRLKVVATEGMRIKIRTGAGFVNGRMYILETDKSITLDTADGVLNRIDRVVLRCDYVNRKISTEVIKGKYSEVPITPELTRNADIYELALGDIYVRAGVIAITESAIKDQRLNTDLCGIVTGLVEQADTTEIFNQFQAYMYEFMQDAKVDFQEWFDAIKGTLEGDVAGNMLAKIEALKEEVAKIPIIEVNNTNTVTEKGIALDARQANPDIEGSLANGINKLNSNLSSAFRVKVRSSSVYRLQELNKPVVIDRFEAAQKQLFIGVIVKLNSNLSSAFRVKVRSSSVYRLQELNKPVVIDRFEAAQKQLFIGVIVQLNSNLSSAFRVKVRSSSVYRLQELNKPVVIDRFEAAQKQLFIGVIVRLFVDGLCHHDVFLFKDAYGNAISTFNIEHGTDHAVRGFVELRDTDIIMNIYYVQGWNLNNLSNVRIDWILR